MEWQSEAIAPDFGEIVAQRRHDLKSTAKGTDKRLYSQKTIAAACGFQSSQSIGRIESGRRVTMIRPHTFWRLGQMLSLTPEEMLEAAGYLAMKSPPEWLERLHRQHAARVAAKKRRRPVDRKKRRR